MTIRDQAPGEGGNLPPGGVRIPSRLPGLSFLRYPVGVEPPEGCAAGITDGKRQTAAIWRDGAWRKANGEPIGWDVLYWLALDTGARA